MNRILAAALAAMLFGSPFTLEASDKYETVAKLNDCVVLLHGLARTYRSMSDIESALVQAGYRVANIDYESREAPIQTLALTAVSRGLGECASDGDGAIHFVTHSLGGILVRQFLTSRPIPRLGRVVMLAPPNQGSEVVDAWRTVPGFYWLNGPAGQQLGTDSDGIPRQLGPVTYPVGVIAGTRSINLILSLWLPNPDDGKVSVESTKVAGMSDFITVPVSHPFIANDTDVIRQVMQFLRSGKFDHGPKEKQLPRGSISTGECAHTDDSERC
ncbi:MAG: esterase/lipase family protein [Burkholderiaceae bacterium]